MRVRVPLHISGFWVPHITNNPLTTGSIGAGITLEPRVEAEIKNGPGDKVLVNSVILEHDLINEVKRIASVNSVNVEITSPSRLGEGLGFSAALSIVVAASALHNLRKPLTLNKVGTIAHEAEVRMMTGLGDVVAELRGGGLVVRLKPGAPGVSELDVIPVRESVSVIPCVIKPGYTTPQMLRDYWHAIKEAGEAVFRKFIAEPSFDRFLELSSEFSKAVFMNRETDEKLKELLRKHTGSGSVITYYFIKKGTLVIVSDNPSEELINTLKKSFNRVLGIFKLSSEGTVVSYPP